MEILKENPMVRNASVFTKAEAKGESADQPSVAKMEFIDDLLAGGVAVFPTEYADDKSVVSMWLAYSKKLKSKKRQK